MQAADMLIVSQFFLTEVPCCHWNCHHSCTHNLVRLTVQRNHGVWPVISAFFFSLLYNPCSVRFLRRYKNVLMSCCLGMHFCNSLAQLSATQFLFVSATKFCIVEIFNICLHVNNWPGVLLYSIRWCISRVYISSVSYSVQRVVTVRNTVHTICVIVTELNILCTHWVSQSALCVLYQHTLRTLVGGRLCFVSFVTVKKKKDLSCDAKQLADCHYSRFLCLVQCS